MPQQIHDGYRPVQRHKLQNGRSVGRNRTNADPHVGKSRNKFGYGIRKRELAGIDQHHRREAGNGLRHRMESKNRIGSHRNIGLHVTDAETLQIDWFSVLLDQYDGTWQFPCGDLIIEKFGDALEFIRRRNVSAGSRAYVDLFGPNRYQNGRQYKSHGTRRRGKTECSMNRCRHDNCSFDERINGADGDRGSTGECLTYRGVLEKTRMNIGWSTQHRSDRMSGVGQTRTSRPSCGMSVSPPRADIQRPLQHVRLVP